MKYSTYRYIYPPRPKNAIPYDELDFWDNNTLVGQPKLNGSNVTIYTNGSKIIVMNRHNQRFSNFKISESEILSLYRGEGWLVINGEYMNKSKNDEYDKLFNHKFVIFDILAYNGDYLVGNTFDDRISLLDELYGKNDSDQKYLYGITENVYRVRSYYTNFKSLFDEITKIDMIEGIVMKRINAKLELGVNESNNVKSQIKCRKRSNSYSF